jgi:hypothetical protein
MNVSEWADTPLLLVLDDTEGAADLVHFVEKIYPEHLQQMLGREGVVQVPK